MKHLTPAMEAFVNSFRDFRSECRPLQTSPIKRLEPFLPICTATEAVPQRPGIQRFRYIWIARVLGSGISYYNLPGLKEWVGYLSLSERKIL